MSDNTVRALKEARYLEGQKMRSPFPKGREDSSWWYIMKCLPATATEEILELMLNPAILNTGVLSEDRTMCELIGLPHKLLHTLVSKQLYCSLFPSEYNSIHRQHYHLCRKCMKYLKITSIYKSVTAAMRSPVLCTTVVFHWQQVWWISISTGSQEWPVLIYR